MPAEWSILFSFQFSVLSSGFRACYLKCNACPLKFKVRKNFIMEGAYFTVVPGYRFCLLMAEILWLGTRI